MSKSVHPLPGVPSAFYKSGQARLKIKTQVSKILNKYLDIMLYTYRPLQNLKQGFNPDLLEPMAPVLFRVKSTGINYGFHLFQLGLLQTTTRQGIRNSRNHIVKGTKIVKLSYSVYLNKILFH